MFICGHCKRITERHEKQFRIVLEIRDRVYYKMIQKRVRDEETGKWIKRSMQVVSGNGSEIVKEKIICKECITEFEKNKK